MPVERDDWGQRIKEVERQQKTARLAVERLRTQMHRDTSIALRFPDVRNVTPTLQELDPTYVIRIFAVFENGLRSYWNTEKPGKKPDMKPLMDAIGSRRKIDYNILKEAHEVRDYRNQIVHQKMKGEAKLSYTMEEVRRRLSLYFDRLPFQWGD
jgi:hypothetical protein